MARNVGFQRCWPEGPRSLAGADTGGSHHAIGLGCVLGTGIKQVTNGHDPRPCRPPGGSGTAWRRRPLSSEPMPGMRPQQAFGTANVSGPWLPPGRGTAGQGAPTR